MVRIATGASACGGCRADFVKTCLSSATLVLLAVGAVLPVFASPSGGTSYSGNFATDDAQQSFSVTLPQPGPLTIRTFSYAGGTNQAGTAIPAGGFDPTVSVFDGRGNLLVTNRDGGCGVVAADPVSGFCWDSYLALTLPAGNYSVVLTQSENLPNGPTLASSFVYTGQPSFTAPPGQSSGFWDLVPNQRTSAYAVDILGGASTVTAIASSATLPGGIVGRAYSPFTFTAQASAGATLTWSITAGSLPTGMNLNGSTGVLSGTPQVAGTFPLTVQVTDGALPVVTQNASLTVLGPPGVTTTSLPTATYGQSYSPLTLQASGGSGSYTWSGSGFPANLAVSPAGVLSGTPNQGGSFSVQIVVSDTVTGLTGSAGFTLAISIPALSITSSGNLGGYVPGGNLSGTFAATGGVTPFTWSATGLPAGLSLNSSTGAFSGTGGNPGVYSFQVQVTDAESPVASASLNVTYSVLGITTSAIPNGSTAAAYAATLAAVGGTGPYTFTATGLPAGLSLSTSGVFSGTPKTSGTFTVFVQVSSGGLSTSSTFALVVTAPATQTLTVSSASLPSGTVSVPYASGAGLQASGGSPLYTWSVFGGVFPSGMSLSASGNLLGTPTLAGTYVFTAQVTDTTGATATGTFTLIVNPAPPVLSLGTFPNGIVGLTYPLQILTPLASGGTPPYSFALANGSLLPGGLTLANQEISGVPTVAGTFPFTIAVTDANGKTVSAPGSILINPAQTSLILSESTVAFSLTAGASGVPTPASVTVSSSDVSKLLNYSYTVSPAVSWLDVSGGNTTPGSLAISVDPTAPSLAASATPYSTVIAVSCTAGPCVGPTQNIAVSLTVSAPPPQLTLSSSLLSFSAFSSNPVASSQTLVLQNTGGGEIDISSITTGSSWLTVSGAPSTLTAGPGTPVTVTANPAGLSAGYYTTTITVNSPQGNVSIPVTFLITADLTMTLGPAGAQFSAPAGSSPGNAGGTFNVSVTGAGTVNWTAALLPGANWITLNTAAGSSTAAFAATASYSLSPSVIAALAPATYYATIVVSASNVSDSQQQYEVVLNITPANTAVTPVLSTAGLIFVSGTTGTTGPQNVLVYTSAAGSTSYQASAAISAPIAGGTSWLLVSPPTGSATVLVPGQSTVSVNVTGLAPGVYSGSVNYAFSSNSVSTVNVTLLVVNGAVPADRDVRTSVPNATGTGCTPTQLVGTQTGLYNNFAQPAGWPTPLSVNLLDNCGSPVIGASLSTTFSNGDPPMALSARDSSSGIYLGTWTPRNPAPQVTVTATARISPFPVATTQVTGQVRTNVAPVLTPNGTLDVFNPVVGAPLVPGQAVQIYGSNMAAQTVIAPTVPLPVSLGGTSVLIGGIQVPLYYVSSGQINAQIPFQLTPGTYQIVVNANNSLSTPAPIQIAAVAPGIANIGGGVIAQHSDYSLVTPASPAQPGEYIVLYLSGMGAVDNPVTTGAGSPSDPLAHPLTAATLMLNGVTIPTAFVGLTPSAVGLYQINFQVPANTPAGNLPLVVSQAGVATNQVILPVQ